MPAASICRRRPAPRSAISAAISWPSRWLRAVRWKLRNSFAPTFSRNIGVLKCSSIAMTRMAPAIIPGSRLARPGEGHEALLVVVVARVDGFGLALLRVEKLLLRLEVDFDRLQIVLQP